MPGRTLFYLRNLWTGMRYEYPHFCWEPIRGCSLVLKNPQNEATPSNMAASMVGAVQSL